MEILFKNLDTFKDIWGLGSAPSLPIVTFTFRYLQGYMGTASARHSTELETTFRYLQGYMGTV